MDVRGSDEATGAAAAPQVLVSPLQRKLLFSTHFLNMTTKYHISSSIREEQAPFFKLQNREKTQSRRLGNGDQIDSTVHN